MDPVTTSAVTSQVSGDSGASPGQVMTGIGGATGWLTDTGFKIYDRWQANKINKQNMAYQREQQSYDRSMQQKIFEREDNAVQRRRADMEKAGLNPILAAGQSAEAGPTIRSEVPQQDYAKMENVVNPAELALSLMRMKADIDRTGADRLRIDAEKEKAISQKKGQDLENRLTTLDVNKGEFLGQNPRTMSIAGKHVMDLSQGIGNAVSGLDQLGTKSMEVQKKALKKVGELLNKIQRKQLYDYQPFNKNLYPK